MGDEDQGFTVRDRRAFTPDGETKPEDQEAKTNQAKETDHSPPPQKPKADGEPGGRTARPLPPVDFGGFILSLSHAAMMHLGQIPDPISGEAQANFDMARHTIDTIAMLEEKTRGNLEEEEQRLIVNALSQLRLAFVRLSSQSNQ